MWIFNLLIQLNVYLDPTFQSRSYFHGTQKIYQNHWTVNFNPKNYIPLEILLWVHLSHLPLNFWNENNVKTIGNALGKNIDYNIPKSHMFSCVNICVEVDLEKGLPKFIQLTLGDFKGI